MLNPFENISERYNLEQKRIDLANLPDIDGAWPNPASLTRFGRTTMDRKTLKRFEAKITPFDMRYEDGELGPCWLWKGGLHPKGYGRFYLGKDPQRDSLIWSYAHRIAFEHWIGIPKPGYIVDHECNVKTCCNPVHLWPLSGGDNTRRAQERTPWRRRNQYSKE